MSFFSKSIAVPVLSSEKQKLIGNGGGGDDNHYQQEQEQEQGQGQGQGQEQLDLDATISTTTAVASITPASISTTTATTAAVPTTTPITSNNITGTPVSILLQPTKEQPLSSDQSYLYSRAAEEAPFKSTNNNNNNNNNNNFNNNSNANISMMQESASVLDKSGALRGIEGGWPIATPPYNDVAAPILTAPLKQRRPRRDKLTVPWRKNESFREMVRELVHESTWKTNLRALVAIYSSVILWVGGWNIITNCYLYFPESANMYFASDKFQNIIYSIVGIIIVWNTGTLYLNAGFQGSNRPAEFFSHGYDKYHKKSRRVSKISMQAQDVRTLSMNDLESFVPKQKTSEGPIKSHSHAHLLPLPRSTLAAPPIWDDSDANGDADQERLTTTQYNGTNGNNGLKKYGMDAVPSYDEEDDDEEEEELSIWRRYHIRFWCVTGVSLLGEFVLFIGMFNCGDIFYRTSMTSIPYIVRTFLLLGIALLLMCNKYVNTLWPVACVFPPWYQVRRCDYHEPWFKHAKMCVLSLISLISMNMIAVLIQDNLEDSEANNVFKPLFLCTSGLLLYISTGSFIGNSFIWLNESERQTVNNMNRNQEMMLKIFSKTRDDYSWKLQALYFGRGLLAFFAQVEHQLGAWELLDNYIVTPTLSRDIVYVLIGLVGLQWSKALLMNACMTPFNVPVQPDGLAAIYNMTEPSSTTASGLVREVQTESNQPDLEFAVGANEMEEERQEDSDTQNESSQDHDIVEMKEGMYGNSLQHPRNMPTHKQVEELFNDSERG